MKNTFTLLTALLLAPLAFQTTNCPPKTKAKTKKTKGQVI